MCVGWPVDRLLQLGRDEAAAPSAGKPDAYHPLAAIKAGDGHADVTPTSTPTTTSTTSESQLRTTRGEEEEQLVQSNTYKERCTHDTRHTTHDTRHTTHDTRHTTHDTRHTTHDTHGMRHDTHGTT
jgi:hypothetical protein